MTAVLRPDHENVSLPSSSTLLLTYAALLNIPESLTEAARVDGAGQMTIFWRIKLPLICDIHFDYKMALAALDHPIDKIRINPGNVGGMDRFRQVLRKCKDRGIPMRIGVNAGSLERDSPGERSISSTS